MTKIIGFIVVDILQFGGAMNVHLGVLEFLKNLGPSLLE